MPRLTAPVLEHALVRLEPLTIAHATGLRDAVDGDRTSFGFTTVPTPETVHDYVAAQLARAATGAYQPFAQIEVASDRIIGQTAYLEPRWWPDGDRLIAVEVGATWLRPAAQGTALNSAAKLLLFAHAFETLGVSRVDLKTDARNARSRAAIQAVGARFEGVLRSWQPSSAPDETGLLRDSAMHSITAEEWPGVRAALDARIAAKHPR